MSHASTRILLEEHGALRAVLTAMTVMIRAARPGMRAPDFASLRAIIFYVREFPEKRHHPKETELLFAALRARTQLSRDILDALDDDHARGDRLLDDLEHLVLAYEMLGECRRDAFESAASRFSDFYRQHMALEERVVLPLAERVLSAEDWEQLDAAFESNRDPLTGREPEEDFKPLLDRIVRACAVPQLPTMAA